MIAYLAITTWVLLLTLAADRSGRPVESDKRRHWTVFDLLAIVSLAAFAGTRLRVGTDWPLYFDIFNRLDPAEWRSYLADSPQEAGFTVLALVVRRFFDSPYALFWVTSTATVTLMYAALARRSRSTSWAVVLYILFADYLAPFNLLRQGLAVAVVFWASRFLHVRPWRFILLSILAASLHASAAVACLAYLILSRVVMTRARFLATVLAGVGVATTILSIQGVKGWAAALNPRYEDYLAPQAAGLGTYLVAGTYFVLMLYVLRRSTGPGLRDATMASAGILWLILGTQAIALARMHLYHSPFLVIALANIMPTARLWERWLVAVVAVGYFLAYLLNYGELLPYSSTFLS